MTQDARRLRFEAVEAALGLSLPVEYTVEVMTSDTMEPVLEVRVDDMVWMVGMIDEPVWGYDLERDPGTGGSWDTVKSVSLGLPEASEPHVVAVALKDAIEEDRRG